MVKLKALRAIKGRILDSDRPVLLLRQNPRSRQEAGIDLARREVRVVENALVQRDRSIDYLHHEHFERAMASARFAP